VWALGCLIYRLAFFVTPFEDAAGNAQRMGILSGRFKIPSDSPYSNTVHDLIKACLEVRACSCTVTSMHVCVLVWFSGVCLCCHVVYFDGVTCVRALVHADRYVHVYAVRAGMHVSVPMCACMCGGSRTRTYPWNCQLLLLLFAAEHVYYLCMWAGEPASPTVHLRLLVHRQCVAGMVHCRCWSCSNSPSTGSTSNSTFCAVPSCCRLHWYRSRCNAMHNTAHDSG
jgi:hypothetical protein